MSTTSKIEIKNLTYTELLATIPWIALVPTNHACQWHEIYRRAKHCKTNARLQYFNLDGSSQYFCHNHLYGAKMDPYGLEESKEVARNSLWQKRIKVTRRGV